MKISIITLLFVFCTAFQVRAEFMVFEQNPQVVKPTQEELKEPSFTVLKEVEYDYRDRETFTMSVHSRVHINNDLGVEKHNRVFIPVKKEEKSRFYKGLKLGLVELKGRVIKPNGEIVEVESSSFKEVENLEGMGAYSIFAFEGAEVGCELEYVYTVRKTFASCKRIQTQENQSMRRYHLKVDFSSAMTVTSRLVKSDEIIEEYIDEDIDFQDSLIPAFSSISEEIFRNHVDFCITKFTVANGHYNYFSYKQFKNNFYSKVDPLNAQNRSRGRKLMKAAGLNKKNSLEQNIGLMKAYFTKVNRDRDESLTAGEKLEMMSLVLSKLKYNHAIYALGDPTFGKLDKDFFSYFYLDDFMIYVFDKKQLISPTCVVCAPYEIASGDINARLVYLFTLRVNYKEAMVYPDDIPAQALMDIDTSHTVQTMRYQVTLDTDEMACNYAINYHGTGYYAWFMRSNYRYLESFPDKMKEWMDEQVDYYGVDPEVKSVQMQVNADSSMSYKAEYKDDQLLEGSPQKLIFNVGMLIGTQSEMYDTVEFKHPEFMGKPHVYRYTIEIQIPQGYQASSLDDLNIKREARDKNGELTCRWTSYGEIKGDKIIVHIEEFYLKKRYELDEIEAYRKVINAAADFNKSIILFERKA